MNHCTTCGQRIARGRVCYRNANNARCLLCQTAQVMTTFRYVSPAARRYRATKGSKHMAAKITLTLEHVDPKHPNSSAMAQTIGLLAQLIDLPAGGLKLSVVCEEEDLQSYVDDLMTTLARRPVGIRVKVKKESEDEIERETLPSVLPMDKVWSN